MRLTSIRIRNFRTITDEIEIKIGSHLTIVGPNNSGKTNILRAIQLFFDSSYYDENEDFPYNIQGKEKTTVNATFQLDESSFDKEVRQAYNQLKGYYENPKYSDKEITAYLTFTNGNPSYQFFPNTKKKPQHQSLISIRTKELIEKITFHFDVNYISSEKNIEELFERYDFHIRWLIAESLEEQKEKILSVLDKTSDYINDELSKADISDFKVRLALPEDSIFDIIKNIEFRVIDSNDTLLSQKGVGIQSSILFSYFLWITEQRVEMKSNVIWLIEEPESYLHPTLAQNLKKIIVRLKNKATVIATTHSMAFIPDSPFNIIGTEIENHKTVIKNYRTYFEASTSIRKSLGVQFSDFFALSNYNLFVEGQTDRLYLERILQFLAQKDEEFAKEAKIMLNPDFGIREFGGVKLLSSFLRFSYEFICKERFILALFDGDDAGAKEVRDLTSIFNGKHNLGFESNRNYVILPKGESIESQFPTDWIKELKANHPNWFSSYSEDISKEISDFKIEDSKKMNAFNWFINKVESETNLFWAEKWKVLFHSIVAAFELQLALRLEKELTSLAGEETEIITE